MREIIEKRRDKEEKKGEWRREKRSREKVKKEKGQNLQSNCRFSYAPFGTSRFFRKGVGGLALLYNKTNRARYRSGFILEL